MEQKTYQKLRSKNLEVAKAVYNVLKKDKAISHANFIRLFQQTRGWDKYQTLGQNFDTVKYFLQDHGLCTMENINGLSFLVATQKCWRTKNFANATKKVQEVTNSDIDKAIEYVTLNNGVVPSEYEGPVVANMLKLEGDHWKTFVTAYANMSETMPGYQSLKYKVIGPVEYLYRNGMIKKK